MPTAIENGQREFKANPTKDAAETVIDVPDWFVHPPENSLRIDAIATDYSLDKQSAIGKAVMKAKARIGNKIQSSMLKKMEMFISESSVNDNVELKKSHYGL